jgi:hypothetical protein
MPYTVIFLIQSEVETTYEIQHVDTKRAAQVATPTNQEPANLVIKTIIPGYVDEESALIELLD